MKLDAPRCARCEGVRFLRVRNVMDCVQRVMSIEWHRRPVAGLFLPSDTIGYFENLICRSCCHTTWFAFDWDEVTTPPRIAYCDGCAREAEHVRVTAVEHTAEGVSPARLVRGTLAWEGDLELSICRPCGLVSWEASDLRALEYTGLGELVDGPLRCHRCHAQRLILVEPAQEIVGTTSAATIAVAVVEARALRYICYASRRGHYALRVCRGCRLVDWYARDLDEVAVDPSQGIEAIGEAPRPGTDHGPYR